MNTITTFILIVFAHVGPMGDGNSNALTSVGGFESSKACQAAGMQVKNMARGTVKSIDFVCVSSK